VELDKAALRRELLRAEPWLGALDVGPQAVDAGTCERCDRWPRLLPTCGPAGVAALCRDCARDLGDEGWCDGHRDEGRHARIWAAQLPDRWAAAVVLWWVATGEVRIDAVADIDPRQLDDRVRAVLPAA
jgi:hypothetical protein